MFGGFPLRPSLEALRFVTESARKHPLAHMPPEPTPARVPNPVQDPIWVAKMVDWFAIVLFEKASLGNERACFTFQRNGLIVTETRAVDHVQIPINLREPFLAYFAQLFAEYTPYALEEDENGVMISMFIHDCCKAFLERMRLYWTISPILIDDDITRWGFEWNY